MRRQKISKILASLVLALTFTPVFALQTQASQTQDIVIQESQGGMLSKGELFIRVEAPLAFNKKQILEVKTTGGLKVEVEEVATHEIVLNVMRTSDEAEAGTITLAEVLFDIDRTVPEGEFDITMTGPALTDIYTYEDLWVIDKYIVVASPNTQDAAGLGDVRTASFTNEVASYISKGTSKGMDVAPYITANHYMMVPLRYVGEALGIPEGDIIFADGTVTLLSGTRTIQLTSESQVALLNTLPVPMEAAMVIKEDRAYIPIGEVAKLLDVKTVWDNETKTATFTSTVK